MSAADFFRQPLAQMIDPRHPLAVLASRLPWAQIEAALAPRFARQVREGRAVAQDDLFGPSVQVAGAGVAAACRPRLPLRLMASLLYLKHAYKLSDEELVERWSENVVWQHFSGMRFYEPRLPCDATQIGRFRSAIGEAGVEELLKATIGKRLLFVSVMLEKSLGGDKTLADRVDEIRLKLGSDGRALDVLDSRLAQLGWHEGLRQTGALLRLTFRDDHVFEVAGDFPRLPDDYVPPLGVTGIKYSINVGSLPSLDVAEVQEVLQAA